MHAVEFMQIYTIDLNKYCVLSCQLCALLPEIFYFFNVKNKRTEESKTKEIRAHSLISIGL